MNSLGEAQFENRIKAFSKYQLSESEVITLVNDLHTSLKEVTETTLGRIVRLGKKYP